MSRPERDFQRQCIDLAYALGYERVAHFHTIQNARGFWQTPVAADGKGFPDLVLVGRGRILFREVKSARGRLEPAQVAWRAAILDAGGDYGVWHAPDVARVQADLEGKAWAA